MADDIDALSPDRFWDFAVAVYGAPDVSEECLGLQARYGVDVNLLLFATYAGAALGWSFDDSDLNGLVKASEAWQRDVVARLRAARVAMKPYEKDPRAEIAGQVAALRQTVKDSELAAERIEQIMLLDWVRGRLGDRPRDRRGDCAAAAAANVSALLARHGDDGDTAPPRISNLMSAALRYARTS